MFLSLICYILIVSNFIFLFFKKGQFENSHASVKKFRNKFLKKKTLIFLNVLVLVGGFLLIYSSEFVHSGWLRFILIVLSIFLLLLKLIVLFFSAKEHRDYRMYILTVIIGMIVIIFLILLTLKIFAS
jgi:cytochrome bd-type quinol oxidase subunit 2